MNSIDFQKMIESRKKTVAMLRDRIDSLSAIHGFTASSVLQATVRIAKDRLAKVERELKELMDMQVSDARQMTIGDVKSKK